MAIHGNAEDNDFDGTIFDDEIFGLGGDDDFFGSPGADTLDGGPDNDTVDYQAFSPHVPPLTVLVSDIEGDAVNVDLQRATQFGGLAEGDVLINIENVRGSTRDDIIKGNGEDNQLFGCGGDDFIEGRDGNDIIYGENAGRSRGTIKVIPGNDHLDGGAGDDQLFGEGADDELFGGLDNDQLFGDDGNDRLFGGEGDDQLFGGIGNDTLFGDDGFDRLDGGGGIDTASYVGSASAVAVFLNAGIGAGGAAAGDILTNIENVTGSLFNDSLFGSAGANELNGGNGNDTLAGLGGADKLIGGNGNDTVTYAASAAAVGVNLSVGAGAGGDAAGDTFVAIENVIGSAFADTITGNTLANVLNGGAGNDVLAGGAGSDTFIVDSAADVVTEGIGLGAADRVQTSATYTLAAGSEVEILETVNQAGAAAIDLVGNEFDNTITGNNGSNTIVGGLGLDTMTGNGGADIFVWTSTAETGLAASEADIVGADFDATLGDKLAVNPIDADETVAGDQAFTFISAGPFTAPGQISFFTANGDTFILLNTDGDATQEATIRILGVHAIDANSFVL